MVFEGFEGYLRLWGGAKPPVVEKEGSGIT